MVSPIKQMGQATPASHSIEGQSGGEYFPQNQGPHDGAPFQSSLNRFFSQSQDFRRGKPSDTEQKTAANHTFKWKRRRQHSR